MSVITCENKYHSLEDALISVLNVDWSCETQEYSLMDLFYESLYMGVDGLPVLKINILNEET